MKKQIINVISAPKLQDDIYHTVGLFEPFKRYGICWSLEFKITESPSTAVLASLKDELEQRGELVTVIFVPSTPPVYVVDWTCKVVSDGKHWFMLADYLAKFGIYEHKSNS